MEIYQARKISNIPTAISQPFDFVCSHNEKFKIKDIGVTEVKTKSDLLRVTSQDKPDIHTQDYVLQLQYHINGTRGHFLLVDSSGEVKANGQCRDQRSECLTPVQMVGNSRFNLQEPIIFGIVGFLNGHWD